MSLPSYVGRYEVRDEIATGGFAVVLRAWDEELESFVALKILHREMFRDEDVQVRFLEESRLLRRIRSPNVVTVHDVGRLNDGRPYFVMDFADRGTLEPRLKCEKGAKPLDPQGITALVDALADGLSAIHDAGVVHRDIKPANILFQQTRRGATDPDTTRISQAMTQSALVEIDERILVGDLGIAKDLVKHGATATIIGGTPLYQAPEQDDLSAEITPAADIYAATALLWHVLTGVKPPKASGVKERVGSLPPAWHDVMLQGMAMSPQDRFGGMESWRGAVHQALASEVAEARAGAPMVGAQSSAPCPYKGLAAYQTEDARFFHGREALTDELVRRVHLHRVLIVGGPSGSGKSSLVRAGLIPALKAGALMGSEDWQIALFTPGRDPITELHFQATCNLPQGASPVSLEDLLAHPTMARHLGSSNGSARPMVLCIDQFEELLTLTPAADRNKFIEALSAMTDPADSRVRVVISVRADFYAACAQIPWLAGRITDNQVLVGPMTGPELRRAVTEPARPAGLYLEPALVDAIIDEAGNEAGSLPLVAHALVETWTRRDGNAMTLEGFRAAGGVAGAISQTADATYEHRFDSIERAATKRLFLRLVAPGEGTLDTRRILARAEIELDSQPEVMHRVVDCLTEARLLMVDDKTVQIAHEALLRTWPRLRGWIEESRDDLRMRQRIIRAAAEWQAEGRDSDLLYRGTPLLSALEWESRNPDLLTELERDFLTASSETRDKQQAATAERERRARRLRRVAVSLLSVLAVGTTVASVVAHFALRDARINAKRAEMATTEAHDRLAGALGAAASGLVQRDPLLALFLGAEAIARAEALPPSYDARAALVAARPVLARGGPILLGSPLAAGDALAIALSPDGMLLAAAQRDGRIDLIDTATRQRIGPSLLGHDGGVRDIDFAAEGGALASVGADGTVRLWTLAARVSGQGKTIGQTNDVVSGVSIDPTGATIASANGDGTVRLWDVMKGSAIGKPLTKASLGFKVVSFSPDGRGIVAGYNDGTIFGWALPSRKPLFQIRGVHTSNLSQIAFSPNGDRIATASTDGTSVVIEYPSGRVIGPAFEAAGQIGTVVFTPDGESLIGGGGDGALKLWDPKQQKMLRTTPSGHSQAILDIALSGDGKLLATLGGDQLIRLWRMDSGQPLAATYKVQGGSAKGVALSDDGERLAAGDAAGGVRVWALDREAKPLELEGHEHQVWALAFAAQGTVLASGDRSGQVRIWDSVRGGLRRTMMAHEGAIWSLAFLQNGKRLMTASDDSVRLWNSQTGSLEHSFEHASGRLTRATLSPDGRRLATAANDGLVRIWDLETTALIHGFAADDNVIWGLGFSPDGRQIATASSDEIVALWDLATGRRLAALTGHMGGATDVAYLADGVTVVAVDRSGQLHWWDSETGRRLTDAWQAHAGASWRIAIHPDGQRFATSGDEGLVKFWDELSIPQACRTGRPGFDAVRRQQYLGEKERSLACE